MLKIWYVALSSDHLPSLLKRRSQGPRWYRARGSKVIVIEIHRKIFKNFRPQNHLAKMLEIRFVAWPSGPLQILFKEGPRIQDGPAPGVLGSNYRNT